MRLLNIYSLTFTEFGINDVPPYIATSHRWAGDETTYQNVQNKLNEHSAGYKKIENFCKAAQRSQNGTALQVPGWIWIDTCCIDKTSSAEVTESINSMFNWYTSSDHCYAYLSDVRPLSAGYAAVMEDFARSEWFRRGWTLQELLAPRSVLFFTRDWELFGHKCATGADPRTCAGCSQSPNTKLNQQIADITGLPESILWSYQNSKSIRPRDKWTWAAKRETTRPEDMAYCLLGIFEVHMPLIYGEGAEHATDRLRQEIVKRRWRSNQAPASDGASFFESQRNRVESLRTWDVFSGVPLLDVMKGKTQPTNTTRPEAKSSRLAERRRQRQTFLNSSAPEDPRPSGFNSQGPSKGKSRTSLHRPATASSSSDFDTDSDSDSDSSDSDEQSARGHSTSLPKRSANANRSNVNKDARRVLSPAQIAAAGKNLPSRNLEKLSMATPAQIMAAGEFLPSWDLDELVASPPRKIALAAQMQRMR